MILLMLIMPKILNFRLNISDELHISDYYNSNSEYRLSVSLLSFSFHSAGKIIMKATDLNLSCTQYSPCTIMNQGYVATSGRFLIITLTP